MPIEERQSISHELVPPFDVLRPAQQTSPFVFCSPHSGRIYPNRFLAQSRLDALSLRKSEDAYVDQLFDGVVGLGAPLITARFPRAYLDVNREPYEFDPELIDGRLPDFANTQSVRVAGGLGTVARIVADGEEIYRERPTLSEVLVRVEELYRPFHSALADLINETRLNFGYAILVDCHSMPSATLPNSSGPRPDFVLGDRFGAACDTRLTRTIKDFLVGLGYDVQLNRPYAGGFITEHYGRPKHGVHALQIEVNRGLYLNEADVTPSTAMAGLRTELMRMAERLFNIVPGVFERRAAE